jgi:hypothetical protein
MNGKVKIRMKETALGAPDHVNAQEYQKGKTYEVPESLANVLLTADPPLAVRVGKQAEPEETKVVEPEETKEEELEETKEEAPSEAKGKRKNKK